MNLHLYIMYTMKKNLFWVFIIFISLCCSKQGSNASISPPLPIVYADSFFAKGADVSWVTEMEAQGIKFFDRAGKQTECISLMKSLGMNAIRLRVWVNPVNGYCNVNDVVAKAIRANNLGMKLLIDFHYSDFWADPGKQNKPASWANQDIATLQTSVHDHTVSVLNALKSSGVSPAWVQVGNETNDGMLWPEGKASLNMGNFTKLINSGYDAVKSVFPLARVVVHISNGYDNALFRWMFDGLKSNGAKWDIIGMSLYPTSTNWDVLDNQCLTNMNDMISRYDKDVMICEVGLPYTDSIASNSFLKDIINKTKGLKNGRGLGVFYWEPQCYNGWKGYKLGAFDDKGAPTVALDAFKP